MTGDNNLSDYERGLRDGRIVSLEKTVSQLTEDVKELAKDHDRQKIAIYMLYGAIALVGLLPDLRRLILGG